MKKVYLLFNLIGIFCIPLLVSATSGACSWHGGVNCSAGAAWDGSVFCNDGWNNSSVRYYDTDECKRDSSGCPYIFDDQQQYQNAINSWKELKQMYQDSQQECINRSQGTYNECVSRVTADYKDEDCSQMIDHSTLQQICIIERDSHQKRLNECELLKTETTTICYSFDYIQRKSELDFCINNSKYIPLNIPPPASISPSTPTTDYTNASGCHEVKITGITWFAKQDSLYYDISCSTPRDINLENEIRAGYEKKCLQYTHNQLLIYNVKLGGINKITFLDNLKNKCQLPPSQQPLRQEGGSTIDIPSVRVDSALVARMSGYILLQVEQMGEAWYLDPVTKKKYYMKDGQTAYEMMRGLGLGITDADLSKIPEEGSQDKGNQKLVSRLKGRILLQVQQSGEAWYVNPKNGKRYYLKDGDTAYQLMRKLGLGITNDNLRKIPVGNVQEITK